MHCYFAVVWISSTPPPSSYSWYVDFFTSLLAFLLPLWKVELACLKQAVGRKKAKLSEFLFYCTLWFSVKKIISYVPLTKNIIYIFHNKMKTDTTSILSLLWLLFMVILSNFLAWVLRRFHRYARTAIDSLKLGSSECFVCSISAMVQRSCCKARVQTNLDSARGC